ncbi:hypothetical protein KQI77_09765 [Clostridium sp. MSJ-8]|uniref:hypothetical protein n=1 Tax=Clostridium sp. MSJ-8 TaxID=2841510 RepID=UPI001C0EA174|nr:hypothetical protein [Clostridium sp. MSJ-8]MBU5488418.1 hypothetical protein [Clostridium sp. MSJ-8]
MYIDDCVNALRILGEDADTNGIYNIASGESRLLKDYVMTVRNFINSEADLKFGVKSTNINKTFLLNANIEKLKNLSYVNKTNFLEGINNEMQYIKNCK